VNTQASIPAIWVHTTAGAFNAPGRGYGAFLTKAQQAQIERVRQARLLFDDRHREYFLDEKRTQFDFPLVRVGDRMTQLYLTQNVLGLISYKGADLLFGEQPTITAEIAAQQKSIDELAERCNLYSLLYGCAVDASYEAECFLEACLDAGQVHLRQLPADEVFPLGAIQPDGQYARYVRYQVRNVGVETSPLWLLMETLYKPGMIQRTCWQMDQNYRRQNRVDLAEWSKAPAEGDDAETDAAELLDVEPTGVARNLITWIPNQLIRGRAVSDYDCAIELQDALNAKNSQVSRVLAKHSDPKLAAPTATAGGDGNLRAADDVYFFRDQSQIPRYIVWSAELDSAMRDRAFVLNQLLVRTETSPVLLGMKEGGAPDAYRKVRLESFNSLTKAGRKAAYWRTGIRRAIGVAQELEQTMTGVRYDIGTVAVTLRDGIPPDEDELATRIASLYAAGLKSLPAAIEELLRDPVAVEKELELLSLSKRPAAPAPVQAETPAPQPETPPAEPAESEVA